MWFNFFAFIIKNGKILFYTLCSNIRLSVISYGLEFFLNKIKVSHSCYTFSLSKRSKDMILSKYRLSTESNLLDSATKSDKNFKHINDGYVFLRSMYIYGT